MERLEELLKSTPTSSSNRIIGYLTSRKKQLQKSIEIERYLYLLEKCQAKTSNGKECSRKCLNVVDKYCQCHIDNPDKYRHIKPKNRPHRDNTIDIDKIDLNDYLKCRVIQINNNFYLVDQYGTLFDRKDYTILGRKQKNKDHCNSDGDGNGDGNGDCNIEWF